jgi:hypothetical protein
LTHFKSHYCVDFTAFRVPLAPLQEQIERFCIDYGFRPAISTLAERVILHKGAASTRDFSAPDIPRNAILGPAECFSMRLLLSAEDHN